MKSTINFYSVELQALLAKGVMDDTPTIKGLVIDITLIWRKGVKVEVLTGNHFPWLNV